MTVYAARAGRIVSFWGRLRKFLGITSEHIYILPTWYCFVFNLLLLVLFIASFPLRNPALLILVFALVFIQLLSMVEAHVNLREIDIKPKGDYLFEAGRQSEIFIQISSRESSFGLNLKLFDDDLAGVLSQTNLKRRVVRKIISNEFIFALFKSFRAESFKASEFITVSKDVTTIGIPILPQKRGVHLVPPIIVTSFFPFGLFRAVKVAYLEVSYASYPRPRDSRTKIDSLDQVAKEMEKAGLTDRSNGGGDYIHHREFLAGDPLRRIDWKASSRRGLKLVRVFGSSDLVRGNILRWQDTVSEDDESKLSELAFSVLKASQEGCYFALELPQQKTRISTGDSHKRECLRLLATFRR